MVLFMALSWAQSLVHSGKGMESSLVSRIVSLSTVKLKQLQEQVSQLFHHS